jgi:hypothetical protein
MERAIAEQLMKLLLALDGPLNSATELTDMITDPEERKAVRRSIGELTSQAYTDLIRPIVRQFPDLDPEKRPEGS